VGLLEGGGCDPGLEDVSSIGKPRMTDWIKSSMDESPPPPPSRRWDRGRSRDLTLDGQEWGRIRRAVARR
jgi:hypothetical protein